MLSSSSIALLFNNLVLRDIFEPTLKDLYSVCIALQSSITKQKNTIRERKVRTYKQTSHHYPSVLKFKKRCRYCSYRKTILICSGCSTAAGKEVPICVCCFEKFHEEQRHLNIRNKEFIKEWKEQAQIGKVRRQKLSELNKKTICRKKLVKKGTL